MSVEADHVSTSAALAKGSVIMVWSLQLWAEPIIISSQTLKAILVIKFDQLMCQDAILSGQDDKDWLKAYHNALEGEADADVTLEDAILCYKERLWVADRVDLRKIIIHKEHHTKVAGQMGQEKMIDLVRSNSFWPQKDWWIEDYVRSCPDWQKNKAAHYAHYGLLQPLELAYRPWDEISIDFIVDLLVSNGCSSIWVVVDCFTKMSHFIPLKNGEKTAAHVFHTFLREILRHDGIPSTITSDRDTRLTSTMWKGIIGTLGIKSKMSSPFHPQTNGQMERINKSLECYLQNCCNDEMDDWEEMLPMAEYAYNNSLHSMVKMTPFFAHYGCHPQINWPTAEPSQNPTSQNHIEWMACIHQLCCRRLENASETMRKYHNRKVNPAPVYQPGHLVMLNGKTLKTRRPARKLDAKLHVPCKVIKDMSPTALKLELPSWWRIHCALHIF